MGFGNNPKTDQNREEDPQPDKVDTLIEAIEPSAAHRNQLVRGSKSGLYPNFEKTYVQKPVGFMGKLELFGMLGKAVVNAKADGVSVAQLIGEFQSGTAENAADAIIGVVAALATHSADLISDIYCVSLGVPKHERAIVKEILGEPCDPDGCGGLSDDDGIELFETFIAQNGNVMRDFFVNRLSKIIDQAVTQVAPDQTQESSKP